MARVVGDEDHRVRQVAEDLAAGHARARVEVHQRGEDELEDRLACGARRPAARPRHVDVAHVAPDLGTAARGVAADLGTAGGGGAAELRALGTGLAHRPIHAVGSSVPHIQGQVPRSPQPVSQRVWISPVRP
jgi:hypothetical protein